MNRIKFFNPKTGKRQAVRCIQPSYAFFAEAQNQRWKPFQGKPRHGTMAEVDRIMARNGFIRDGARWRSAGEPQPAGTPRPTVKPKWVNFSKLRKLAAAAKRKAAIIIPPKPPVVDYIKDALAKV